MTNPLEGFFSDKALSEIQKLGDAISEEVKGTGVTKASVRERAKEFSTIFINELDRADGKQDGVITREVLKDKLEKYEEFIQKTGATFAEGTPQRAKFDDFQVKMQQMKSEIVEKVPETFAVDTTMQKVQGGVQQVADMAFAQYDKNQDGLIKLEDFKRVKVVEASPDAALGELPVPRSILTSEERAKSSGVSIQR